MERTALADGLRGSRLGSLEVPQDRRQEREQDHDLGFGIE